MGLFDDYATPVDEIPEGFGLAVGTYPVVVSDIRKFEKKDGSVATIVTFSVDTMADVKGRSGKQDVWVNKPVTGQPNADINAKMAKKWCKALGVPDSVMAQKDFELYEQKEHLVGVEGVLDVTAGNKAGYTNQDFKKKAVNGVSNTQVPDEKAEVPLSSDW